MNNYELTIFKEIENLLKTHYVYAGNKVYFEVPYKQGRCDVIFSPKGEYLDIHIMGEVMFSEIKKIDLKVRIAINENKKKQRNR